MKILVAGGTGFLGSNLVKKLIERHHEIVLLTRRPAYGQKTSTYQVVHWPLTHDSDLTIARQCQAIVNLAGESIAGHYWSENRKNLIRLSRIQFTRDLVDAVATSAELKIFLSGSATGFYGDRKSELLTEESPRGTGFLADVCRAWEAEANVLRVNSNIRVVNLRTGTVLARGCGFLGEIERIYRLHLGGPAGSGDQFISWIHLSDWLNAVLFILENATISGPVNLVAPEPITNGAFSRFYRTILNKPFQVPAPEIVLKLILGEQSALLLESQNARPKKLDEYGFRFEYPSLRDALEEIYKS